MLRDADQRRTFWESADSVEPGLSEACGCYVFAIRAGRGIKPWYVGKAERQSFKREAVTEDKLNKYELALRAAKKGTPLLYFYARTTKARGAFSRPSTSAHRDIGYLEKMLIGLALKRNKALINKQETTLLQTMVVPGLLNTPQGGLRADASELRWVMGY
ncbi:MAG: hypothetical protein M9955_19760 [Rhizobiaceae bacterium]|nr:hypothetical protein [Rhizobiaceae bacterium]